MWVQFLDHEDFLKEMASHSSILTWKIPWTEEPGRLQSTGLQGVRHDWVSTQNNSRRPRRVTVISLMVLSQLVKGTSFQASKLFTLRCFPWWLQHHKTSPANREITGKAERMPTSLWENVIECEEPMTESEELEIPASSQWFSFRLFWII